MHSVATLIAGRDLMFQRMSKYRKIYVIIAARSAARLDSEAGLA